MHATLQSQNDKLTIGRGRKRGEKESDTEIIEGGFFFPFHQSRNVSTACMSLLHILILS